MLHRDEVPIVWLHGFMGSAADLAPFAHELGGRRRCLMIDLPGHGARASVPATSVEAAADAVAHEIASSDVKQTIVVGYSLGGRVAMSMASRHPALVRALIVESASPGIVGSKARKQRRLRDDVIAESLVAAEGADASRRFLERWYRQSVFTSLRGQPAVLRRMVASRAPTLSQPSSRIALAEALSAFSPGRMQPLWEALPRIVRPERPALFIAGERDGKYQAIGRRVGAAAPSLRFCSLKGAGHIGHFERPRAYANAVKQFLDDLPG